MGTNVRTFVNSEINFEFHKIYRISSLAVQLPDSEEYSALHTDGYLAQLRFRGSHKFQIRCHYYISCSYFYTSKFMAPSSDTWRNL